MFLQKKITKVKNIMQEHIFYTFMSNLLFEYKEHQKYNEI